MTNQKIAKYLNWALQGVLYLVLLTPLLISGKYVFPFITTKTMFFRLIIELAVLLYVVLAMLAPKFRPKMTKLSWAIVIFGIIILITGITGVDFYKTFWGTIERGEGFLTISHLIIYFLILTWTFKSKKEWLNYLTGLVIVSLFVDLYAILQKIGVEKFFLFGRIIHPGESRLSATIGNAAFLGAYTLGQFFLSLFLFLKRKKWWKILFGLGIIFNFFILFQTQTRGAILAWLVVFILLCLFYTIKCKVKLKKNIALGILITIVALTAIIWTNKNADWVQANSTLKRLTKISRTNITTESRLLATDTSWKGWKDRFILGYGWENYNIAFNKYFHAEIFKDAGSQLWFDRAHNTIFDVALATGIFGLINYLIIFGLALFYLFKNIKTDFDFSVILIAFLLAHFLQNIFVFDVLASYITLFIVWALIVYNQIIKEKNSELPPTPALEINSINSKKGEFNLLIFTPVLLIIIFGAYFFNIKPLQANQTTVKALISASQNKEKEAIVFFKQAIDMQTYQTTEIRQKLGDNIILFNNIKNGLTDAEVNKNFEMTISEFEKNISEHPWDVQNYLYLMAVLNKAAAYNPAYYEKIIDWGEKALILSPTRPQTYFEMGQARISQGRFAEGVAYFTKAVALNPKTLESHWNLMAAYILAGENEKAAEIKQYIEEHGRKLEESVDELNRLYSVYLAANRKDKLIEIMEKIVTLEPSAAGYARLAAAYKEMGRYDDALIAVQKAVELDNSLTTEAKKFIETLK